MPSHLKKGPAARDGNAGPSLTLHTSDICASATILDGAISTTQSLLLVCGQIVRTQRAILGIYKQNRSFVLSFVLVWNRTQTNTKQTTNNKQITRKGHFFAGRTWPSH